MLIGQIDAAEHQMFFGHFQLCVLPASPPLESLPQKSAWKCSFFNCQFNLPPSVRGHVLRGLEHISRRSAGGPSASRWREFAYQKKKKKPERQQDRREADTAEDTLLQAPVFSSPRCLGTDRILGVDF